MKQLQNRLINFKLAISLLFTLGCCPVLLAQAVTAPQEVQDPAIVAMQKLQADELAKLAARGIKPPNGMVLIPAGEFLMGSNDQDPVAQPDELPQQKVDLDAYWIDKTEVTLASYMAFCTATGRPGPRKAWWAMNAPVCPVVNVSREDAMAYAKFNKKTLPTEAQWEKACRGTDGRRFSWGEDWPPIMMVGNLGPEITGYVDPVLHPNEVVLPSNQKELGSPWGVYGMTGSVWEWTADWYAVDIYKTNPKKNPTGLQTGTLGIVRGGAWYQNTLDVYRCAARLPYDPTIKSAHVGFRCVQAIPAEETPAGAAGTTVEKKKQE